MVLLVSIFGLSNSPIDISYGRDCKSLPLEFQLKWT